MLTPLRLVHLNREKTDDPDFLIHSAALSLHMADGEKTLLSFYTRQSTGFFASISRIERDTGMRKRNILYSRKLLCEDGLLLMTGKYLYLDWNRLRLFASLSPDILPKQRAHRQIAPVCLPYQRTFSKQLVFDTVYLTNENDLITFLGKLQPEEYEEWRKAANRLFGKSFAP